MLIFIVMGVLLFAGSTVGGASSTESRNHGKTGSDETDREPFFPFFRLYLTTGSCRPLWLLLACQRGGRRRWHPSSRR